MLKPLMIKSGKFSCTLGLGLLSSFQNGKESASIRSRGTDAFVDALYRERTSFRSLRRVPSRPVLKVLESPPPAFR